MNLMDDIRALVAEMEHEENQLLARREKAAEAGAHNTLAVIVFGVPLAFILLGMLALLLTRDIAIPLRKMTAVAEQSRPETWPLRCPSRRDTTKSVCWRRVLPG